MQPFQKTFFIFLASVFGFLSLAQNDPQKIEECVIQERIACFDKLVLYLEEYTDYVRDIEQNFHQNMYQLTKELRQADPKFKEIKERVTKTHNKIYEALEFVELEGVAIIDQIVFCTNVEEFRKKCEKDEDDEDGDDDDDDDDDGDDDDSLELDLDGGW